MYALVIGRSFPSKQTNMSGIFEFEQAMALHNNGYKIVYAFCDTSSIKSLHRYGYIKSNKNNVVVYGYYLPIKGMPLKIFNSIKKRYYKRILEDIIKHEGIPDIIHIHFPLLAINKGIWELLKDFNIPIVITEHWSKVQLKRLKPYQSTFLNTLVNEADSYICVGDLLKKSVVELTNTSKDIEVVPNMVSPFFFYKEKKDKNKDKDFKFVSIGRLISSKRFDLIIDAFTQAFSDNPNVHLTIVGGGPLGKKLKKKTHNLGMADRISMVGLLSREETANTIRESDAFVSASVLETFGVPFIEAMTCGKPVIGIRNGAIDRYIDDSNGILFEQDNLDDLVKALTEMYHYKELYNGKAISENAKKLFSEEAVVGQLNKIFVDCVERY